MANKIDFRTLMTKVENMDSLKVEAFKDYEGNAQLTSFTKYVSNNSGKTSIAVNFNVNGNTFRAYEPLTDKTAERTVTRLLKVLSLNPNINVERILGRITEDGLDDSFEHVAVELATQSARALEQSPVTVWVKRTKNEENGFWNVRWDIANPEAPKAQMTDDFFADK